jgi:N-acetyl-alpha-D-muramate 1-phosphate uridylyltransferase
MRPQTERIPKALLEVAGEPFAHHQLSLLAAQGFTSVVFCVGYRGAMIREFAGDGVRWGLSIGYTDEGTELRGTAGALRLALDAGLLDDHFTVLYGDSYLPIDVRPVVDAFERAAAPALMTVLHNRGRWDRSNVVYAGGRVLLYRKGEPDPRMEHIDYGLSVLARDLVAEAVPEGGSADLSEVFHDLSVAGRLAGYEVVQRFYEVGSPAGFAELEQYLADTPSVPFRI